MVNVYANMQDIENIRLNYDERNIIDSTKRKSRQGKWIQGKKDR